MDYEIPEGIFTSADFARLNKIKHSKTAWRVLNRYVETGRIRLVRVDHRKKIYRINTQMFTPRYIPNRTCVCPPREVDYIYRLMGVQSDGGCGGSPS